MGEQIDAQAIQALNDVLSSYVVENANLKIQIRQLEMKLQELSKDENKEATE